MPALKRAADLLVRCSTRIPISHSHSNDLAKAESLLPGRLPSRTGPQIAAVFADHTGLPGRLKQLPAADSCLACVALGQGSVLPEGLRAAGFVEATTDLRRSAFRFWAVTSD
jgi:hypothetical protein